MTIATKSDLRSMFGPARDQGRRPTCLAFATSDAHAAVRGPWVPLSCEYIFHCAQRRGRRNPDQGATLPAMMEALKEDGQPLETGWPYLAATPADVSQWVPPSTAAPVFQRASEFQAGTIDAIVAELGKGRPVVTLMRLSRSFFRVPPDGVVDEEPGERPDLNMRHAVVAVGHGEARGQQVILVRNSWGGRWGINGYGWITAKFLRPRVLRLLTMMEDLSVSPSPVAA